MSDLVTPSDRILVVGASGPIGRAVVRMAQTNGMNATAASRRGPTVLDVSDPLTVARVIATAHPDALVYLVGTAQSTLERDREAAVDRMRTVVEAAVSAGAGRVVLSSSAAVYGDRADTPRGEDTELAGLTPYALEKIALEEALDALGGTLGVSTVSLRIFNVFGEGCRTSLINALREGPKPTLGLTDLFVRDYVHVDDVAEAVVRAVRRSSVTGSINIARGIAVDNLMLAAAAPGAFVPAPGGPASYSVADVSKAGQSLDWRARVDPLDYLRSLRAQ
ncbi:NAD-dependent epimerase/dehydratase family protein [Microbacterium sp. ASV49]|uniref:NAD-dependent epimerase/dehydratase family protein n=1 Tax=Microbacterium candidum TaxID=3041922 RepID=A0ABT7N0S5_9MICO|nr:NAD-dependent epimerase/dehydratase family protein [Microbacterium sp. ASV49]MDL9980302.1 NAD-dependent epimerase/dehydratase family protein [Microbacterium sp. ASV49]